MLFFFIVFQNLLYFFAHERRGGVPVRVFAIGLLKFQTIQSQMFIADKVADIGRRFAFSRPGKVPFADWKTWGWAENLQEFNSAICWQGSQGNWFLAQNS